jgi:hypothetical protein
LGGFEKAIEDGSFERLFFNNPMVKNALQQAKLKERIVFHLANLNMSNASSTSSRKNWLDIIGLKSNAEQIH